jgi:CRP/FNR family transcriptional regulator, cyclic AMP receptor protein
MKIMHFKPGEVVFEEDSISDCAYLVEEGKFEVSRICNGRKQVIGTLKAKDIFGEMGLIDDQPRSATVTALEESEVSVITQECFHTMERTNPEALVPLLRVLSARIRDTYKLPNMKSASF